jgi:type IV secretory pathway TrbL component
MTTRPAVQFGRRGLPQATNPVSQVAPPAAESARIEQAQQSLSVIKKMLILIPIGVAIPILMAVMIKPGSGPSDGSSGAASAHNSCRSKAAAGSIFDIDWCKAGAAAVQGAVRGVAGGAGARR